MTTLIINLAFLVLVSVYLMNSIKIAGESERFAVFFAGRFQAFKGPGLILVIPVLQHVHRLQVGDIGVLTSSEFARFNNIDVPVRNVASLRHGQAVRIDGFDGVEPRLLASSTPEKTICPNCGHNF